MYRIFIKEISGRFMTEENLIMSSICSAQVDFLLLESSSGLRDDRKGIEGNI